MAGLIANAQAGQNENALHIITDAGEVHTSLNGGRNFALDSSFSLTQNLQYRAGASCPPMRTDDFICYPENGNAIRIDNEGTDFEHLLSVIGTSGDYYAALIAKKDALFWSGFAFDNSGMQSFEWYNPLANGDTDTEYGLGLVNNAANLCISPLSKEGDAVDALGWVVVRYTAGGALQLTLSLLRTGARQVDSSQTAIGVAFNNPSLAYDCKLGNVLICGGNGAALRFIKYTFGGAYSAAPQTMSYTNHYSASEGATTSIDVDVSADTTLRKFVVAGYINDGGANDGKAVIHRVDMDNLQSTSIEGFTVHADIDVADYVDFNMGKGDRRMNVFSAGDVCLLLMKESISGDIVGWWSDDGFITKSAITFNTAITGVSDIGICRAI